MSKIGYFTHATEKQGCFTCSKNTDYLNLQNE